MADLPNETPTFETDEVKANRAIENGQGVGARELAAQRDPGGINTADEEGESDIGASATPDGNRRPDDAAGGKGAADGEEQLTPASDA